MELDEADKLEALLAEDAAAMVGTILRAPPLPRNGGDIPAKGDMLRLLPGGEASVAALDDRPPPKDRGVIGNVNDKDDALLPMRIGAAPAAAAAAAALDEAPPPNADGK